MEPCNDLSSALGGPSNLGFPGCKEREGQDATCRGPATTGVAGCQQAKRNVSRFSQGHAGNETLGRGGKTHDADPFEGVGGRAEEQGQPLPAQEVRPLRNAGHVLEQVVEDEDHARDLEDVGSR